MQNIGLEFRLGTLPDIPAIVGLVESAYRGTSSYQGWTTEAAILDGQRTDPEEVRELIGDPRVRIILAYAGDVLVGCVVVRDEGGTGYIGMLAIKPERQASGLGRLLLAKAERCALEEFSAHQARMTVIIQREELIRWYERRGYARTEHREPWPYGNLRFGQPRRSDLEFIVLVKPLNG